MYFITVDTSRLSHMQNVFESTNTTFLYGTTPETLPLIHIPRYGALCSSDKEYACLVSHLATLEYAVQKSQDDYFIICEDDVQFEWLTESFDSIIQTAPDDWECLQLYTNNPDALIELAYKYDRTHDLWIPWQEEFWSTLCYCITRRGANKLISRFRNNGWDFRSLSYGRIVADDVLYRNIRTYTRTLPLCVSNEETHSLIHSQEHIQRIHTKANAIAKMIRYYIQKI
jgi:GR25 family glycosyltransferase involved in LPS biosynthesis